MSEERDRKWAYGWVAEAIRQRLMGSGLLPAGMAREIHRIRAALEAAADVPRSPSIDICASSSPGGLAGAPPPAGDSKAVPPVAGAVESSLTVVSAALPAPREQEAAVEASPGSPSPASSSRELSCDDVVRWLNMYQPRFSDAALTRRCDDHLLECASCRAAADVRELADAARLG